MLKVIEEEYKSKIKDEVDRQRTIEGKAAGILGVIGVSISLVGILLGNVAIRMLEWRAGSQIVWGSYLTSMIIFLCAIASIIFSFLALRVMSFYGINDKIILNEEALERYGKKKEWDESDKSKMRVDYDEMLEYHRLIIRNAWQRATKLRKINDTKSKLLRYSQGLFVMFIVTLTIGIGAVYAIGINAGISANSLAKNAIIKK